MERSESLSLRELAALALRGQFRRERRNDAPLASGARALERVRQRQRDGVRTWARTWASRVAFVLVPVASRIAFSGNLLVAFAAAS